MKKLSATIPTLSRHVNPSATTDAPNCQVAALKASEIQYAMKLVTPHFLACGGTGSRSSFVLYTQRKKKASARLWFKLCLSSRHRHGSNNTHNSKRVFASYSYVGTNHLALPPSENVDLGCSTCRRGFFSLRRGRTISCFSWRFTLPCLLSFSLLRLAGIVDLVLECTVFHLLLI